MSNNDTMFLCGDELSAFNITSRTHHKKQSANILFADGHVISHANKNGKFTVDVRDYAELPDSFSKILSVFEQADTQP